MKIALEDAINQLDRHRGVTRVGDPVESADRTVIEIDVPVELSSRSRAAGISHTGVRALETCYLSFDRDWPIKAPSVWLRADFPTGLPHINPHQPGKLVSPCLFEGSTDELLHRFGLDAIIDQLVEWLRMAAAGDLIDLTQGWEPTRRDFCASTIVFSAEQVVETLPIDGNLRVVRARYVTTATGIYAILDNGSQSNEDIVFSQTKRNEEKFTLAFGEAASFIAHAPSLNGILPVCAAYQPESVIDVATLAERAANLGIDSDELIRRMDAYYGRSVIDCQQDPRDWTLGIFAIVILIAQRPAPLVGSPSRSTEVLPYVVRYQYSAAAPLQRNSTAHPAFHSHALSPALLAQVSGTQRANRSRPIVMLGCGSLGSKVALHLGRAGFGNLIFVDYDVLSPHNLARHALLGPISACATMGKAHMMKGMFEGLSHPNTKASNVDAVNLLRDSATFHEIVPADEALIVDATASLTVMAAETVSSSLDESSARLVRIAMFGQGRCVTAMFESRARTCRVDDLTAEMFERCRFDENLRDAVGGTSTDPTRVFVGDNCRSMTTPMPDSVVSRSAATLSMHLEQLLVGHLPDKAILSIGMSAPSDIAMSWQSETCESTTVLSVTEDGGWHIRVLAGVARNIAKEVANWLPKETGGALIGRVSYETRTITIAGLVDAPADSTRLPSTFVLGTTNLVRDLKDANDKSLGHLRFVGTWHSHPNGGAHSGIDRETLHRIAEDGNGLPVVSLVWTPSGLLCAVQRW